MIEKKVSSTFRPFAKTRFPVPFRVSAKAQSVPRNGTALVNPGFHHARYRTNARDQIVLSARLYVSTVSIRLRAAASRRSTPRPVETEIDAP